MHTSTNWLRMALILAVFPIGNAVAQSSAKLGKIDLAWSGQNHIVGTDLVRFNDAWVMVCCENPRADRQEGVLRIIGSKDSLKWESLAIVESPTQGNLLSQPRLSVQPDGHLVLKAYGILAYPQSSQLPKEYGNTVQTLAWTSVDGRKWSQASPIGEANVLHGKSVPHGDIAYSYSRGCICGNAQTFSILSSADQKLLREVHHETLAEFFPDEASLLFTRDQGICLMSRVGGRGEFQTALLGIAKDPFQDWQWKETASRVSFPNLILLVDDHVLVVVGLLDKQARTSLCRLNLKTGIITELVEIPTDGVPTFTGASYHNGMIWLSIHSEKQGKKSAYLAQVKLE